MRIGIDARFMTHPQRGGFKTYTENLVAALAEINLEDDYFLYLDREPQGALPTSAKFCYRVVAGETPMIGMIWREQVRLARQAAQDKLDLFHAPCLTGPLAMHCPMVVTIHDIIWRFPNQYSRQKRIPARRWLMEMYFRYMPEWTARHASIVLTVSQAAKESIVQHLHLPVERVLVTYEGTNPLFRQISDTECIQAVFEKYDISQSYILAIGSADPRKNITTLIQAYSLLPDWVRDRFELVVVWNHVSLVSEVNTLVEKLGLKTRVKFIQQVSNEDLVYLYNGASLFVFPSLYEGFGLPLLEAMSCGVPVIAANNSSIPEIVGEAALLVDEKSPDDIRQKVTRVLLETGLRRELSDKGAERSKLFSWDKCANETVSAYHKALLHQPELRKGI